MTLNIKLTYKGKFLQGDSIPLSTVLLSSGAKKKETYKIMASVVSDSEKANHG
jgi:hypothetical protein